MDIPFILTLLLLPSLGALVLVAIPVRYSFPNAPFVDKKSLKLLQFVALFFSFITFIISILFLFDLGRIPFFFDDQGLNSFTKVITKDGKIVAFSEQFSWFKLESLDIEAFFSFKIDGISILLIVMSTFFFPMIIIFALLVIRVRVKEFLISLLFMETAILGAFVAWDLLLFYLFWEVMLIPMYLIIGIWGGEQRIYAALKFFIYTIVGSFIMFLVILFIYNVLGSFNFDKLYQNKHLLNGSISIFGISFQVQHLIFLFFSLSFMIKVPLFPFHTWLPDAHVQAPTVGSVLLAGILLKMGTYGLIRFTIPLFPEASFDFAPYISILAIISIIYGAMMAFVQVDIKKYIAYSSVSHMGFVTLGLFSFEMQAMVLSYQAVQGAIYQMISHGLSTGCLFLLIGMIYERCHTRSIDKFGGIAKMMPIFSVLFMIVTLSSIGFPGLNGFVGEFLILLGVFRAHWSFSIFASIGVILSAIYMLFLYQKVFFEKNTFYKEKVLIDLSLREIMIIIPFVFIIFIMGIYPNYFLDKIDITLSDFFIQHSVRWVK